MMGLRIKGNAAISTYPGNREPVAGGLHAADGRQTGQFHHVDPPPGQKLSALFLSSICNECKAISRSPASR